MATSVRQLVGELIPEALPLLIVILAGGSISATHTGQCLTPMHGFVDQIVMTAFLLPGVFAIIGQFNTVAPMANTGALLIGFLVASIGSLRPGQSARRAVRVCGCSASWPAGNGSAFPWSGDYGWVPIAGPRIGGVVGGGLLEGLIRPFQPHRAEARASQRSSPENEKLPRAVPAE